MSGESYGHYYNQLADQHDNSASGIRDGRGCAGSVLRAVLSVWR